ncbi:sensor histidine kinase (plasmid) [Peteryoungia desertarenae]|uniref:C4-dicarboxylate transport sensor protein n=1 Tax=Peteryoungia desertarenae TaxID=1813451 RepID=A0ABX6QTP1_9HYPH|nr:ATP-binding protein [Peteryoungia desertarenae]QLF71974.1 sensor histidine kinase [Peteryoungia desertarenae]
MTTRRSAFVPTVAALLAAFIGWFLSDRLIVSAARSELDQSLLLTSRAVRAEIDRFRSLPDVAGEDGRIRAALIDPAYLDDANRYLETIARHAGAAELFLINKWGTTIAASNWNRAGSFIGQDYSFRPYFSRAMIDGHGEFYAIGVTTGVPGYFLSTRILNGDVPGVLVVKVDLKPLQTTWQNAGADIALADADGVVFLSGKPRWIYRPLWPLSTDSILRLEESRAYDGVNLSRAQPLFELSSHSPDIRGSGAIGRLMVMPETNWRIVATRSSSWIAAQSIGWAAFAALATFGMALLWKVVDQRRQILQLKLQQSDKLETMVEERTRDLATEVEARQQAEIELRAAQDNLVHSEKMAALGRMSTAIVHEISQPLAAMEATLTAAQLSLQPADQANVGRIDSAKALVRRMQRTTKHLKSFGRKESGERCHVDLREVLKSAADLVHPRSRLAGVEPQLLLPPEPVLVLAGSVRMEQVAVNLMLNALDATEGKSNSSVVVSLAVVDGNAEIRVRDTGIGIAPDMIHKVTEPFYSSKTQSDGLGLGLSICKAILTEFGGRLSISSVEGSWTEIIVEMPLAHLASGGEN